MRGLSFKICLGLERELLKRKVDVKKKKINGFLLNVGVWEKVEF